LNYDARNHELKKILETSATAVRIPHLEQYSSYGLLRIAIPVVKGKDKIHLVKAMKVQRGSRGIITLSFISAQDGVSGQRHAPAALPSGKRAGTHCIVGWVGLRDGLHGCGKTVQPIASRYID